MKREKTTGSDLEHAAGEPIVGCQGLLEELKLTVREASRMMRLGETSLRRLLARGGLPAIRVGCKTLLLRRDCEAFLASSYGVRKPQARTSGRLPPLPAAVANSELI